MSLPGPSVSDAVSGAILPPTIRRAFRFHTSLSFSCDHIAQTTPSPSQAMAGWWMIPGPASVPTRSRPLAVRLATFSTSSLPFHSKYTTQGVPSLSTHVAG